MRAAVACLCALAAGACGGDPEPVMSPLDDPGPGISRALAEARAAAIGDLRYEVTFTVPAGRAAPVEGQVTARFTLDAPLRVVLDFAGGAASVGAVTANGRETTVTVADGHVVVPAEAVAAGENAVTIAFTAGDASLNRNDEFLYTLFVPARARLAFPVFDQPDLKARYTLTLDVPEGWAAVANGAEAERATEGGRTRVRFEETAPLPTYLFAFAAGRFEVETAERDGRQMRLFHRETDADRVARNRDQIFDLHATALAWLEEYTATPYPFGKFDFVAIPSFQFGGMEHPGAILYNAASLFLDPSATQNQMLNRASLIAHETAHMWFGDLVTMRWFDDVWMKEVFANFMAAKIVNPSFPDVDHDLRFLLDHHPAAYGVDRTPGTNAIRQPLANLDDAGQMYGAIIYDKAPIAMRQLEVVTGEDTFRDGLREYLDAYAFGNATWLDLVAILDARVPVDLAAWSRNWVESRGRPEFRLARTAGGGLTLEQTDPLEQGRLWPQRFGLLVGGPDGPMAGEVEVAGTRTELAAGPAGFGAVEWVLPNADGLGYGLFALDDESLAWLLDHVEELPTALARGSAWVTLWENLLEGRVVPADLLDTALRVLPTEPDEQNVQRVLGYATAAFWRHLPEAARVGRTPALEAAFRAGLARAATASQKAAWFAAYRDVVATPDGLAWLERVWRRDEAIPGLELAEPDEMVMAFELAVREVDGWQAILDAQLARIENPDRRDRFAFVMPALSANPDVRAAAFARLADVENRRREAWVVESLGWLHHPLRSDDAVRFIEPSLALLPEIQRTGDIFFPTNWTGATLGGHRSPEAAAIVREFLARELQFPQRLRWTVLVAADGLFRAAQRAG
jgi:aminopeptidase N